MGKKEQHLIGLSKEQEEIFEEYYVKYNDIASGKEKKERQKYIYEELKKKKIENTGLEKLLDLTILEIDNQFKKKEHFENRFGFLMAFWGLLFNALLEQDILKKSVLYIKVPNSFVEFLEMIIVIILYLSLSISLILLVLSTKSREYLRFTFENRTSNFKRAVDDKEISYIAMLEIYTNIFEQNERKNDKYANNLTKTTISIMISVISMIVVYYFR